MMGAFERWKREQVAIIEQILSWLMIFCNRYPLSILALFSKGKLIFDLNLLIITMISTLLAHKIRKDVIRDNKKHNHKEYLHSLQPFPQLKYWSGYHKKKLVFFALVALLTWHYELHHSVISYIKNMRSPKQYVSHLLFGTEKIEKTVSEQAIGLWQFEQSTLEVLTKIYYETDKRLIFGVGRNLLYQVYTGLGLLQKKEDEYNFWVAGGFYKKRNQLISGVGYKQFMVLFGQAYKTLKKTNPDLIQQDYLRQFLDLFVSKAPQIEKWEKKFNKDRYGEYLKGLLTDNDRKLDEISSLMRKNLDISEQQVEQKLESMGMKGLSIRDKWVYWRNREVLFSIREFNLHKRINSGAADLYERRDLERKLSDVQKQLSAISVKKESLKQEHMDLYMEELA